ncbi:MAG TPA: circularly permuted type 2 ATP-grasp protein [Candidatus Dormibacteraeota bacterium]|nr:circularly permuted type 2 ATP-grasp protein [Candidatus Dormibacteraeota bacterium]
MPSVESLGANYQSNGFYDEMLAAGGRPRPAYRRLYGHLEALGAAEMERRHELALQMFRNHGITFAVYPDAQGNEKVFPFDIIPRVITARTWRRLESGLKQRLVALNLFLDDIYGRKLILKQRAVPPEVVLSSPQYLREVEGLPVPHGIHCHIAGIDLVRDHKGEFFVLEDNLRTPSGVSYVLANRHVMKRVLPDLFAGYPVRPVEGYTHELLQHLRWLAPHGVEDPSVVLLTPGINNSAYYEHLYLAKQMGIELVEGTDLVVDQDHVFMRTTHGLRPVHVIYRRLDDEWLDPIFGRQESLIGVAGLVSAYRAGNVAIANALGNGVADDKAVYALIPKVIRYYLGEDPILPNVHTYLCAIDDDRRYVLEHLDELVVKTVDASGGYGMLIGPASTKAEREGFRRRIEAQPRAFVAQPVVALSVQPILDGGRFRSAHQDLRPFILTGPDVRVTPGGLTRVALKPGSLIVNSSQGGGSRDTWVMAEEYDDDDLVDDDA